MSLPVNRSHFQTGVASGLLIALACAAAHATVFGRLQGIVHDEQHRPIAGARILVKGAGLGAPLRTVTNGDGYFSLLTVPLGQYQVIIQHAGFGTIQESVEMATTGAPMFHIQMYPAAVQSAVRVTAATAKIDDRSVTPSVMVSRKQIERSPGADRTNSLAMITDYVPGAYEVHDMLHIRGGHQVNWQIDGVSLPNTNIASTLGPQIDPKDIETLEVQRGSYEANLGDRTYGVFDVSPRNGFDRIDQAELVTSLGSYWQTNDQLNFGSHTERFAYYGSVNGNYSQYGLMPPVPTPHHDAASGYGGFVSLVENRTPRDQLRFVGQLRSDRYQIPYDPNANDYENSQYDSSGLRDTQHEASGFAILTWVRTLSPTTYFQLSPFFNHVGADYQPGAHDTPVASTANEISNYAGAQASVTRQLAWNTLDAGFYSYAQHDHTIYGAIFNPPGPTRNFLVKGSALGGLTEEYVSNNLQATHWLTLIAGFRASQFAADISEFEVDPRFGVALRVPKLGWVFRAFYGRYYQAPPLITATGALAGYAQQSSAAIVPLHGERDEEHQFGVAIPLFGWTLDADNFETRANNFLDHSNIGESNLFFPVTIDGALIQGWELTLGSPQRWRYGHVTLAYSNQLAQQRGPITGGLICEPASAPQCDAGFNYVPLDHDQRNTLNTGYSATLPWATFGSVHLYYGSGFTNGLPSPRYPGAYLPHDTNLSFSLGKTFRGQTTMSVSLLNATDRRVLLDNSLTFGGFHYNAPREVIGEARFRFRYGRLFHHAGKGGQ